MLLVADVGFFGENLHTVVGECLAAGCRWVVVRAKKRPVEEVKTAVKKVLHEANEYEGLVFVNSFAEVAAELDAHGVHLPQGYSVQQAKQVVGKKPVGVSAHSLTEALEAEKDGADYVTLSPVFPSISKEGYSKTVGLEGIKIVSSKLRIPVVALGGIRPGNAASCLLNGAKAVALLGALSESVPPSTVIRRIIDEIRQNHPQT